jgi:signal transduction histidine kinase
MAKPAWLTTSDVVVPVGVVGIAVLGLALARPDPAEFRAADVLAYAAAVAQGVPLVARRHHPLPVLVVVWSATVLFVALRYPPVTSSLLGLVVAVHAVTAYATVPDRVRVAGVAGLAVAVAVVAVVAVTSGYSVAEGTAMVLLFVTAAVIGDRARTRRRYVAALEDRARILERERETQREAAAAAERTRIARELHDVIAHGVSVMVLHATGAREVIDRDPGAARRSLELIAHTGREALHELRTVVGALRTEGRAEEREPQQGLGQLDALVQRTAAAGLAVSVVVEGEPVPLRPAVDLSAYRIVQEALANTLKHAGASTAEVVIRYGEGCLVLHVTDDGTAGPSVGRSVPGGGLGLVGMGERVAMLGGRLETGRRSGEGFEVLAVLPTDGDAS